MQKWNGDWMNEGRKKVNGLEDGDAGLICQANTGRSLFGWVRSG